MIHNQWGDLVLFSIFVVFMTVLFVFLAIVCSRFGFFNFTKPNISLDFS